VALRQDPLDHDVLTYLFACRKRIAAGTANRDTEGYLSVISPFHHNWIDLRSTVQQETESATKSFLIYGDLLMGSRLANANRRNTTLQRKHFLHVPHLDETKRKKWAVQNLYPPRAGFFVSMSLPR
jgi:hypothetical protein